MGLYPSLPPIAFCVPAGHVLSFFRQRLQQQPGSQAEKDKEAHDIDHGGDEHRRGYGARIDPLVQSKPSSSRKSARAQIRDDDSKDRPVQAADQHFLAQDSCRVGLWSVISSRTAAVKVCVPALPPHGCDNRHQDRKRYHLPDGTIEARTAVPKLSRSPLKRDRVVSITAR